jgi:hypothetical protein
MKAILFLSLMLVWSAGQATVRTVSQNVNLPAQYTDINAAIGASAPGDTIYIHASPDAYNYYINLNKRLVIIGLGIIPGLLLARLHT